MKPIYLILTVIVLVVLVLFLNRKVRQEEGFGIFRDLSTEFTNGQRSYFHDQAGKAILVNKDINLVDASVNGAFQQGEMYLPTSPDRDFSVYFQEDDNQFTERDYNLCRGVQHPRNLKRAPKATIGCGWWFVEDPTRPSTAALGFPKRPVDPKLGVDYAGGRWVWSLTEAAKLEDIKRCKRVKTCEAINGEGIREECGFCEELGYAIPVDSSGRPRYPDETEAICPRSVIRSADNCPTTTDILKRAGAETPDEEVFDPSTGKVIQVSITPTPGLCTPDRNGNLTIDCLISLATSNGMSPAGTIIRRLRKQPYDLALYNAAKGILQGDAGITIVETSMDVDTATTMYSRISLAQNHGLLKVREAAKYLSSGNPNFDICYYEDKDVGPFSTTCLQREFRKAGCQLSGKAAPSDVTSGAFSNMTWKDAKQQFANLFQLTRSKDAKIQDKAILDCIGTQFHRPQADICDEPGIEYRVFTNYGAFIGRFISKEGLVQDSSVASLPSPVDQLLRLAGPGARLEITTNATVRSSTTFFIDGLVSTKSPVDVRIGLRNLKTNQIIPRQTIQPVEVRQVPNAPTLEYRKYPIPLKEKDRNVIQLITTMNDTKLPLTKSDYMKENIALFQLSQPSWKPLLAYDFYTGQKFGLGGTAAIQPLGSRTAAVFDGGQTLVAPGIHSANVKSVCWMQYLSEFGNYPEPFIMRSTSGTKLHFGVAHQKDREGIQVGVYHDKGQIYGAFNGVGSSPVGRWVHYAIVFHNDRTGFHLYIDGKKVLTSRGVAFEDTVLTDVRFADKGFKGGIGWFHVYDYPLTIQEVKRDMNYENPDYQMETPEVPNIRIRNYLVREYEGSDYPGGDYDSLTFTDGQDMKNLQACQDACGNAQQCVAYTFNPFSRKCWLKNRIQNRTENLSEEIVAGRIVKELSVESDWDGNNKCLDVLGFNQNDGAAVKSWNCNGFDNQKFAYDDKERLVAKHSGKCLEIENGSTAKDARLIQRTCSDADHQKWLLDGAGRIHPKHNPAMCMDLWGNQRTDQGGNVVQWDCHNFNNQKWIVRDAQKATNKVTFFDHCDYVGRQYEFGPGVYMHGTHFQNDVLSSVKVPPGRTAVVYKHGDGGPVAYFTSDVSCFVGRKFNDGSDINDQISRIVIE
jgi:hypothetical protein